MAKHPNHQPKTPNRRTIRMKGYDYSSEGLYFLTLICYKRRHLFGHIKNESMCLNDFGTIVWEEWLKTSEIRPNIALLEFIAMPNHIHGIIHIKESAGENQKEKIGKFQSPSETIGAIVRGFKGAVTRRIRAYIRELENEVTRKGESHSPQSRNQPHINPIDLDKSIWHRDYWDIIIPDKEALIIISNYIRNNPAKWSSDKLNNSN